MHNVLPTYIHEIGIAGESYSSCCFCCFVEPPKRVLNIAWVYRFLSNALGDKRWVCCIPRLYCCTECWVSCHNVCRPLYLRHCAPTLPLIVGATAVGSRWRLVWFAVCPSVLLGSIFPSLGLGIFTGFVFTCNEEIRSELWCKYLLCSIYTYFADKFIPYISLVFS